MLNESNPEEADGEALATASMPAEFDRQRRTATTMDMEAARVAAAPARAKKTKKSKTRKVGGTSSRGDKKSEQRTKRGDLRATALDDDSSEGRASVRLTRDPTPDESVQMEKKSNRERSRSTERGNRNGASTPESTGSDAEEEEITIIADNLTLDQKIQMKKKKTKIKFVRSCSLPSGEGGGRRPGRQTIGRELRQSRKNRRERHRGDAAAPKVESEGATDVANHGDDAARQSPLTRNLTPDERVQVEKISNSERSRSSARENRNGWSTPESTGSNGEEDKVRIIADNLTLEQKIQLKKKNKIKFVLSNSLPSNEGGGRRPGRQTIGRELRQSRHNRRARRGVHAAAPKGESERVTDVANHGDDAARRSHGKGGAASSAGGGDPTEEPRRKPMSRHDLVAAALVMDFNRSRNNSRGGTDAAGGRTVTDGDDQALSGSSRSLPERGSTESTSSDRQSRRSLGSAPTLPVVAVEGDPIPSPWKGSKGRAQFRRGRDTVWGGPKDSFDDLAGLSVKRDSKGVQKFLETAGVARSLPKRESPSYDSSRAPVDGNRIASPGKDSKGSVQFSGGHDTVWDGPNDSFSDPAALSVDKQSNGAQKFYETAGVTRSLLRQGSVLSEAAIEGDQISSSGNISGGRVQFSLDRDNDNESEGAHKFPDRPGLARSVPARGSALFD